MKRYLFVCTCVSVIIAACQKTLSDTVQGRVTNPTPDSVIAAGDTLTYEVITNNPDGWFGIWNEPDGSIMSNPLDSVTYGSPAYYASGWRHTFICPGNAFQAFISVATKIYDRSVTVNLYKNNKLIKSAGSKPPPNVAVASLLVNTHSDTMAGTSLKPILTYEVLLDKMDTTKFQSDRWTGQWNMPDEKVSDLNNPLLSTFAIPSGWKYTFRPGHLPFRMYVGGTPYSNDGSQMTINFYVNGILVKTQSSRSYIYGDDYIVQ